MAYVSRQLRRQVEADAQNQCGYCRTQAEISGYELEVEHLIPESRGGLTIRDNLWLGCSRCNRCKSDRTELRDPKTEESVPLFNPRTDVWTDHFEWEDGGLRIRGLSAIGRAAVEGLRMNARVIVTARAGWIRLGGHPPND